MNARRLTSFIGFTLLFLLAIAFNVSPYLRGPDEWRWVYAIPSQPWRLLIPGLVLAIYLAVMLPWRQRLLAGGAVWRLLLFLWLAVPLIQLSLLAVNSPNVVQQLFFRTISAGSSGFFSVGSAIDDGRAFLSQYPDLMPTFPVHPQRYPPGIPISFYVAGKLFGLVPEVSQAVAEPLRLQQCQDFNLMRLPNEVLAAVLWQMSLPLWSGLVLFPLYGLALAINGRRTALLTAVLYPLVPSFALWAGRWDQFFPLFVVTGWYLFCLGWQRRWRWAFVAAGAVLSLASAFSFGLLAILLPMGLWALLLLWQERQNLVERLLWGLLFGVGLAAGWLVYQLVWGIGFWDIWHVSMDFHLGLERSYWVWLGYHLYDFSLFLGIPVAILFWAAVVWALREWGGACFFPLAFGVGLLLLNLSGTSRGEVARVWLFFTPFALLCAACYVEHMWAGRRVVTAVAALLVLQLLCFTAFLRVVTTSVEEPPARERLFERPPIAQPLMAEFEETITLLGYELLTEIVELDSALSLVLYWEAEALIRRPYTVFVHLLDEDDQLVAQQDNMPVANDWPMTCWMPNEVVIDMYELAIPGEAKLGSYQLMVGLYWWETAERLVVYGENGVEGERVWLADVIINGPEQGD